MSLLNKYLFNHIWIFRLTVYLSIFLIISQALYGKTRYDVLRRCLKGYKENFIIYIDKSIFRMYVYNRRIKIVAEYPVGYGSNPDKKAKSWENDKRTPAGVYHITEILSMYEDKASESYSEWEKMDGLELKAEDGFSRFRHSGEGLGKHAYGPVVFCLDYPNKNDIIRYKSALKKKKTPRKDDGTPLTAGSGIAIHGNNDPEMVGHPSSPGCIIMHNTDSAELLEYATVGTIVIIY